MNNLLKYLKDKLPKIHLVEDDTRIHTQFVVIFLVLSLVSLFMTYLNKLTHWYKLGIYTLTLAFVCFVCFLIEYLAKSKTVIKIGRGLFCVATIYVLSMFAIIGEPEGFSVLWSLLIPSCGFFLFRRKYGMVYSISMFIVIAFLFWTQYGNMLLQYEYTDSFKQRFPIIYISFFIVGYIFEFVRERTQSALSNLKNEYEHLYNHDMLTGLYNRYGFNSSFDEFMNNRNGKQFAFAIIDLDYFKAVNDTYGHTMGDVVLKEFARRLDLFFGHDCILSRWGGEEFSILFKDDKKVQERIKHLVAYQKDVPIELADDKIFVHISVGVLEVAKNKEVKISEVVRRADDNLYEAKITGRNKYIYCEYSNFKKVYRPEI